MQLPRGTFHSMKKGMKLDIILNSLKEEVFSGSCSLICENHTIDLVLQDGNIVLASYDSSCGNAAMDIMAELHDHVADASLSDLTPAQMKLTLEFNTECRVRQRRTSTQKPAVGMSDVKKSARSGDIPAIVQEGHVSEDMHHATSPSLASGPRSPLRKVPQTSPAAEKPQTAHTVPMNQKPPIPQSSPIAQKPPLTQKAKIEEPPAHEGEEYTVMSRELDALDSMDLDTMSDKIRANCKSMIEKLHLEHLMEHQGD